MKNTYEYVCPTAQGYKRVYISRKDHNRIFPNRPIKSCAVKYLYFLKEDGEHSHFKMYLVHRLWWKFIACLLYPIALLIYGLANFKEVNREYRDVLFELQIGSFSADTSNPKDKYWNSIMEVIQ